MDVIELLDLTGTDDVDGFVRVPNGYRLTRDLCVRDGGLRLAPGVGLTQNREDGRPPFVLEWVLAQPDETST